MADEHLLEARTIGPHELPVDSVVPRTTGHEGIDHCRDRIEAAEPLVERWQVVPPFLDLPIVMLRHGPTRGKTAAEAAGFEPARGGQAPNRFRGGPVPPPPHASRARPTQPLRAPPVAAPTPGETFHGRPRFPPPGRRDP